MPQKDICRICLERVCYNDVEDIDLNKLDQLIKKSLLPKWQLHLFQGHIICTTCISNFRTLRNLNKYSWKSHGVVMGMNKQIKKKNCPTHMIDLKQMSKFQNMRGNFFVCRLCLEPTKNVALYLYDNSINILPMEYISMMLRSARLYMVLLEKTLNPILCFECWQRVQVLHSFQRRMELVTCKFNHYQKLLKKIYLDKQDLEDIVHMWDKLGVPETETSLGGSEISILSVETSINDAQSKDMPVLQPASTFFEEHNYFKRERYTHTPDQSTDDSSSSWSTPHAEKDMPVLMPSALKEYRKNAKYTETLDKSTDNSPPDWSTPLLNRLRAEKNVPVLMPSIQEDSKIVKISARVLRNKGKSLNVTESENVLLKIMNKKRGRKPKVVTNNIKKTVASGKSTTAVESRKTKLVSGHRKWTNICKPKFEKSSLPRRTRARKNAADELYPKDLLVLQKEEIIRKKRVRNTKSIVPEHTSTPKPKDNSSNPNNLVINWARSPFKPSTNEYTFERLNFDNEVQMDRDSIEEDEIQIKREAASDSGEDFTENTSEIINISNEISNEQCPNLDAFIKSEPADLTEVNEGEEGPPELEFQGPCNYGPQFIISEAFSVNERSQLISVEEKRDLIDSIEENLGESRSGTIDINKSSTRKCDPVTQNVLPKLNSDKTSLLRVRNDLTHGYKPLIRDIVINLTKCDMKAKNQVETPSCSKADAVNTSNVAQTKAHTVKQLKVNLCAMPVTSENNTQPSNSFSRKPVTIVASKVNQTLRKVEANGTQNIAAQRQKDNLPHSEAWAVNSPTSISEVKMSSLSVALKRGEVNAVESAEPLLRSPTEEKVDLNRISMEINSLRINKYNPYRCKICNFLSTTNQVAKCHLDLHMPQSVRLHRCDLCQFATMTEGNLNVHKNRKHSVREGPREGALLISTTKGEVDLNRLNIEINSLKISKSSPYRCKICNFLSTTNQAAKCHLELHMNTSTRLYRCHLCCYKTMKKDNLDIHNRDKHGIGGEMDLNRFIIEIDSLKIDKSCPYRCKICNVLSTSNKSAKFHLELHLHKSIPVDRNDLSGKETMKEGNLHLDNSKHGVSERPREESLTNNPTDEGVDLNRFNAEIDSLKINILYPYRCRICNVISTSNQSAKHHLNYMHKSIPVNRSGLGGKETMKEGNNSRKHGDREELSGEPLPSSLTQRELDINRFNIEIDSLDINCFTPYRCKICNFLSRSNQAAKYHLELHMHKSIPMNRCDLSGNKAVKEGNLHVGVREGPREKPLPNSPTNVEVDLNRFIVEIDSLKINKSYPYRCKICNVMSTSNQSAKYHLELHMHKSIPVNRSDLSGQETTKESNLHVDNSRKRGDGEGPREEPLSNSTTEGEVEPLPNTATQRKVDLNRFNDEIDSLKINKSYPYRCKICNVMSTSNQSAKYHLELHMHKSIPVNRSDLSGQETTKESNLHVDNSRKRGDGEGPREEPLSNSTTEGEVEPLPNTATQRKVDLNRFNDEIDSLKINKSHPYRCRLCNFVSISKLSAKCHLELHMHKSISTYRCDWCGYSTTSKSSLSVHNTRKHRGRKRPRKAQLCGFCNLEKPKIKCLNCVQFFHPNCLLTDLVKPKQTGCSHFAAFGCMFICKKGYIFTPSEIISLNLNDRKRQCSHCKAQAVSWVHCRHCGKIFHYSCFQTTRMDPTAQCRHNFNEVVVTNTDFINGEKSAPRQGKMSDERRNCEYCGTVLDSVIPCPSCFKFMHNNCFIKDSKMMKFNCKHFDIVGEDPTVICEYCKLDAGNNSVECTLCNRTLHTHCFTVDQIKMTLKCKHVLAPRRRSQYVSSIEGRQSIDAQTPPMLQPLASTSKDEKQEMLDLSTFIMLCD